LVALLHVAWGDTVRTIVVREGEQEEAPTSPAQAPAQAPVVAQAQAQAPPAPQPLASPTLPPPERPAPVRQSSSACPILMFASTLQRAR
jgi:hypothetical protein